MKRSEHEFRVIAAGKFKAICLELMDEVYENRNLTIIITKHGKPVAQMTAPPLGIKLSGPTVELDPESYAVSVVSSLSAAATEAFEEHRKKKKDKKKKHK